MSKHLIRCLPFVFAVAFFLQGWFGSLSKSLTWDEPVFVASGYSYLLRNDFRTKPEAPPLLQQLQALPLLTQNLRFIPENHPVWQKAQHIALGRHFVHANAERVQHIAKNARLPVLLIGAILVLAIFAWGKRLFGPVPALTASALAAGSPNLLAHAKLATTDLGCAAFMFFAVFSFWRSVNTSRWYTWTVCGLITGLALLTKYTALLLGPIYLVLGLVCLWQKRLPILNLFKAGLIVTTAAILTIGAGYNLSFNPFLYWHGLQQIYTNANTTYQFYLLGQVSEQPWWYYYLITLAIKTPFSTLALIGLASAVSIRRSANREAVLFLLVPTSIILIVTCFDPTNLGYRRILPALPFLLLFCAHALSDDPSRLRTGIVLGLTVFSLFEAVRIYPHHLAYFSPLSGGPKRGPHLLDDSNIDWGQDLPGLARWQRQHPDAQPMKLMYFGNVPPEIYGVHAQQLPLASPEYAAPKPGYYAISAHNLVWFRKIQSQYGHDIDWLTQYRPVDHIGYSIYIYKFPESKDSRLQAKSRRQ